jgi:2-succinyl-5-enolpyruvyl-6-hydroxy-3-cyclohexene-1-carboxylate synthase
VTARPEDVQAAFAATLLDEWVRAGVRHAVVCPGSRSTPLALACAAAGPGLALHVHHDERSAGFLALGLGLATGVPAVVVVTSGTAAAELHPAVVEAHQAGVPLLVCTADRPPELQDVGAPQVIDQAHLYGRAVRWFTAPGVPTTAEAGRWRPLAARAVAEATGDHPGPVHLDLAFREPLVGDPAAGGAPPGRPGGAPWLTPASDFTGVDLDAGLDGLAGRRGVIVAGEGSGDGPAVHGLAARLGWPVLAEPRSPAWAPAPTTVAHLDALLRSPRARDRLVPEVVVRLGAPPASRVVNEWLAGSGAHDVVVAGRAWSDPAGTAATVLRIAPADLVEAWPLVLGPEDVPPPGWLDAWRAASDAAEGTLARELAPPGTGQAGAPHTEPGVARGLVAGLPDGAALVVSSSMPVRDVERYAIPRSGLRILGNRGANGIDGVVSTAVGVAAGSAGPTALLIGDIAFLHDSNGLLGAAHRGVDLVCVVVDNDGGGIFSFLPQARTLEAERFERLFGTPHGLDLVAVASAFGVEARPLGPGDDVGDEARAALAKGGVHVLVARTDRQANVTTHARLDEAVAAAVDAALDGLR